MERLTLSVPGRLQPVTEAGRSPVCVIKDFAVTFCENPYKKQQANNFFTFFAFALFLAKSRNFKSCGEIALQCKNILFIKENH